ncbi:hypothetical protein BDK51DRAFT_44366 [Blyttiomyces helicus]|uniref:Uncharacterized protein n=1 Tax=Blyttiomyces helicus TaxID=388810 RepID=A0A4P9WAG9_9FUNG|nr:hypothetical protein BDK51DRAFT_44366 [Blyttiomyces helicus]|eukprot:RKO87236.1 hypothetical protein BDK51DRAFT_44366 [Blyttiomyces helicus]
MIGDTVRDKDGVSALAVFAEIAINLSRRGLRVHDYLEGLFAKYGYFVSENSYFVCHSPPKIAAIFRKIRYGAADAPEGTALRYPTHLGRFKVTSVRDLTVGYDSDQADKKPVLPVSASSEMITFRLDNGSVITLRTSGTEPKIKYYSELAGASREAALFALQEMVAAFVDALLEPEANGLIARQG